jgi:hypothetical protein
MTPMTSPINLKAIEAQIRAACPRRFVISVKEGKDFPHSKSRSFVASCGIPLGYFPSGRIWIWERYDRFGHFDGHCTLKKTGETLEQVIQREIARQAALPSIDQ